jgi:DNA-binding FadR family transcriptional regulator
MTSPSAPRELGRASPFTAVRRLRSFDEVVAQIQGAILSGRYQAGDRLPPERDLCALFEVSRPTLREALRALEVLGSLDIRPGKRGGIFVASPSGDGVGVALAALIGLHGATAAELNEFRAGFEGETAALAATRASTAEIEAIAGIAAQAQGSGARGDSVWSDMVAIDLAFHEAVAAGSHNRVRVAVMLGLHHAVQRVEFTIAPIVDDALLRSVGEELTGIAAAIAARDADRARAAMGLHVERFGVMYIQMQDREAPPPIARLRGTAR